MKGWVDGRQRRLGSIQRSLHSLSLSRSDGQKTNRCFEKKKERKKRRESRGENKHSLGRQVSPLASLSFSRPT